MTQDISKNGNADHMPLPVARDLDINMSSLIVDDAFNSRTNMDGSSHGGADAKVGDEHTKVSHVQDSMQSAGQITPILVETRRMGQGKNAVEKYYLISGFRRVAAARKLGWDTIKARAFEPMSEKQRIYLNLLENTARQDISAYDTAMACSKLVALGETSEQVGLRLGKSDSYIRNLNNSATKLSKQILNRWKVESSAGFGAKLKVCSTDWLAKVCNMTPEQQEVEYYSKLSSKDKVAYTEATGKAEGDKSGEGGTEQPKATIVKRPSKLVIENAVKALLAKCNAGNGTADILLVMEAFRWVLGVKDNVKSATGVMVFDPETDKFIEPETKK